MCSTYAHIIFYYLTGIIFEQLYIWDYPLFLDTREDALKLLQMTENGEEQVGGEIVFE